MTSFSRSKVLASVSSCVSCAKDSHVELADWMPHPGFLPMVQSCDPPLTSSVGSCGESAAVRGGR